LSVCPSVCPDLTQLSVCPSMCPHLTQQLCPGCKFVMHWGNFEITWLSHDNILSRPGTTSLLQKVKGHTYILKVHAITIRDYRYNNTKKNVKQLATFILFSFHTTSPACLRNLFGGIRHLCDSSCWSPILIRKFWV
jgi:hypothetical protein